jgi:hypothetical protein
MRKLILLLLAFALTACGAAPAPTVAPTQAPLQPTQTAALIVQTVVVTVVPTNLPTEVPPATSVPPTPVPPTAVPPTAVPPTQGAAPTQAPVQAANGATTALDNALGAGWFNNLTVSANNLSLRCQLYNTVTFGVTPSDRTITQVQFYYRVEDKATGSVFDWQNFGRMAPDANGNFTLAFSGDNVGADFRKPNAWFDFQFVGLSRTGGVVGRSEKINQQVNFSLDCPQ